MIHDQLGRHRLRSLNSECFIFSRICYLVPTLRLAVRCGRAPGAPLVLSRSGGPRALGVSLRGVASLLRGEVAVRESRFVRFCALRIRRHARL